MDENYLWQYVMQINPFVKKEDVEEIKELNADHKKEMESITSAINNLNIVTTKLYERLGEVLNERNE